MILSHRFVSHLNFLFQHYDENNNPIGQRRFKEIVEDCWFISKSINTSYTDVQQITPLERKYLIDIIKESNRIEKEEWDKTIQESKNKNK